MDPVQSVGELIEQGQNSATNTVKTGVVDVKKTVQDQVGLQNEASAQSTPTVQNQTQQQPSEGQQVANDDNDRTQEVVRDFYSPAEENMQSVTPKEQEQLDTDQRLSEVRQRLYQEQHNEVYYQPLISYEQRQQHVESKIDQLENEKRQEMQDLEVKQAGSPPPLAVSRAQTSTEINRGVAG